MPVSFETDLYVEEGEPKEGKLRGTIEDFQNMLRKFDQIFKEEGTDNVVWVMDYSWEIRNELDLAVNIWPQDVEIGWLFFNLF